MGRNTTAVGNKPRGKKFKRTTRNNEISYDEMAAILKAKVNISDEEVKEQYKEFTSMYPEGKITLEEFSEMFGTKVVFSPDSIFRVFDEDKSGSLDFMEFTLALNCTNLTQPEDKLRWIFNVFDEDGGGFIDAVEVEKLVVALLQLTEIQADKENIEVCVEALLEALDEDGNGQISKEEFINNALDIEFISGILSNEGEKK